MARTATVSSITLGAPPEPDRDDNLKRAVEMIDQCACDQPDLIVLPEVFTKLGIAVMNPSEWAEPLDGPTVTALAERARRHRCYIVCPFFERAGETVYNSAALIDRAGEVAGVYRKVYLTLGEMEAGVRPGVETPVFETDFGKVGIAICFDLNFWEVARGLKAGGAELIAFASMYRGGLQLISWAFHFRVFMVSATPTEHSRIVDPLGRVLGDSSAYGPIVTRRLNLDCAVVHIDFNHERLPRAKRDLGPSLEVVTASPEAYYLLINHDEKTTIGDLLARYEIETLDAYHARARAARATFLDQGHL